MIASPGTRRITIMLDDGVIYSFKSKAESSGRGYQTMMNEALRQALDPESAPVTLRGRRTLSGARSKAAF